MNTVFLKLSRRAALAVLAVLVATPMASHAQQYPSQDIYLVCAFPAGSGSDILVRYFAEKLRPLTGRTVIVENRPGAASNIAMEYVARAKPNGYTIYVHAASSAALSGHLLKSPSVDVAKQLTIAATINQQPYMLLVDAKSPHKTLAELTVAMKVKGDKATYGSPNTVATIVSEIYKVRTGVRAVEVNFKVASDMLNELASGAIDFAVADPVFSLSQMRAGRIRILGLTTAKRFTATDDLPTLSEQGVPMDITGWWAAMVPTGTPPAVIDQINKWFVQIVSAPDTKTFLAQFGGDPLIETPEAAQARLIKDIRDWGDWARLAKIQPQ